MYNTEEREEVSKDLFRLHVTSLIFFLTIIVKSHQTEKFKYTLTPTLAIMRRPVLTGKSYFQPIRLQVNRFNQVCKRGWKWQ